MFTFSFPYVPGEQFIERVIYHWANRSSVKVAVSSYLIQGSLRFVPQDVEPNNGSAWAQYTIQVDDRVCVQEMLREVSISTAVDYPILLNRQRAVADDNVVLPIGDAVVGKIIGMPMHPYLDVRAQREVINAVTGAVVPA